MNIYQQSTRGFTLVEMLVAVSVLLIVIVGPMTITARIAKSATFATEQVQAFFLAQEGIELAQKGRDDLLLRNFLPPVHASYLTNPWTLFTNTSGTYQHCYSASGCGLEWDDATSGVLETIANCATSGACRLNLDTTAERSKYTHRAVGTQTLFTRQIYFTPTPATNPNAVRVRSVVTWRTGSIVAEQRVEVESYLYNIYATN